MRRKRALILLFILIVTTMLISTAVPVFAKATVRILAFNKGWAWVELFGPGDTETELLKNFEAAEDIDVQIEWGDEAQVRQKAALDLATRSGQYDILMVGSDGGVQTYAYGNALTNLTPYLENKPTKYLDPADIYPAFLEANTVEGKIFALPYYSFGPLMGYRQSIFNKFGLMIPRTTQELVECVKVLKAGLEGSGIYPITMRGAPGEEPTLDLAGFTWAFGGTWFEGDASTPAEIRQKRAKPTFNTGGFAQGFKLYTDLLREYGPPGSATYTWVEQGKLAAQGKAAIVMPQGSAWSYAWARAATEEIRSDLKPAPIPVGPTGRPIMSFWTFSLGMNQYSKNKDATWKVLNLLTGKDSMQGYAARTGRPMVTMRSVLWSDVLIKKYGLGTLALWENAILVGEPHYFPYIPELNSYMEKIGTSASRVIAGSVTADQALEELQNWAVQTMTEAGYYE